MPQPAPHRPPPRFCVWELTLACDARCIHCGSSAGAPRPAELDTPEALALCDALADLGVPHVTLSGGEPLLRPDWEQLAARLVARDVAVELISNGLALDDDVARRIARSGVRSVTLSIDGPEAIHDALRGVRGAFSRAVAAAARLRRQGLPVGAATQINARNIDRLEELELALCDAGFQGWQLQLTMPHGRCAEHADLVVPPAAVLRIVDFVLAARARRKLPAYAADNIGWMLRCEPLLRSRKDPPESFYPGCQAGLGVIGLASDGTVRGCLSLPPAFDEGNVRDRPLAAIWHDESLFAFNRRFRASDLTGACAECPFARVCRGGCKSLAVAVTGGASENPYCARLSSSTER
ncbi:MAG: radical SAM protein [Deltaproteobacteria bacterium]|nr:radical SAM protein [Deltaproteobacteria bacterium]